jgi:putative transposase
MTADFCVEALEEAIARYGSPEIFNTDQGSQFTAASFVGVLQKRRIRISRPHISLSHDNYLLSLMEAWTRRAANDHSREQLFDH